MKVYRITKDYGQPLILDDLNLWEDVLGGLEHEEVGNRYTITIAEMTEEDYKNLPEWAGL